MGELVARRSLAMASVATASTVGHERRRTGTPCGMPIVSPTGPANAIDTGISASDTKKSRLDTRPSMAGGTRRCSSVPQRPAPRRTATPQTNRRHHHHPQLGR